MKKTFTLFALLFGFAIWQGCAPKTEESSASIAKDQAASQAVAVADKKTILAKASAEKYNQRMLAAAEKAKKEMTYTDANGKVIYYKAEVDPSYAGGMDAMRQYLKDNLQYPTEARENGIEGTVFVDFVIDEKGRVREVVATDIVGDDVDESFKTEAVRVVSAMPGWKAGVQHGKAVDTSFSIPITFEIVN